MGWCVTWDCPSVIDGRWFADLGNDKFMHRSQGTGWGIQLHVRGWVSRAVNLVHCVLPWSFSITTSCLPGKLYSCSCSMMKSRQMLCGTARQTTKFTREVPKWMPTTQLHHSPLLRVVGKTELRHEGEGSIKGHQIFICHTALSPRLSPHSIMEQTTKKTAAENNNNNTVKSLQRIAKKQL